MLYANFRQLKKSYLSLTITKMRSNHYAYKLSKWLLTINVLWNVFAFSGSNANANSVNRQKPQTELVYSTNTKTNRYTASLRKATRRNSRNAFINNSLVHVTIFLMISNRFVKVKIESLLKRNLSIIRVARFLQPQYSSRNSSKDIFTSIG